MFHTIDNIQHEDINIKSCTNSVGKLGLHTWVQVLIYISHRSPSENLKVFPNSKLTDYILRLTTLSNQTSALSTLYFFTTTTMGFFDDIGNALSGVVSFGLDHAEQIIGVASSELHYFGLDNLS